MRSIATPRCKSVEKNLSEMSDKEFAELQASFAAEQKRREDERRAAAIATLTNKNRTLFANRDLLLSLMEHSRTSCSDTDLANRFFGQGGHPRCYKCALMALDEFDLARVEINVEVTVREVQE